ncbi:MAG: PIN domain nuclease of toxin-antitoxin system [Verrucomicrobiales bacterium]
MNLLVDSHVIVWWLDDPGRLSREARDAIRDPANRVFFSAASVWELGLKIAAGKLMMSADYVRILREDGFEDIAVTVEHADASQRLPFHHRDPFDRLLIAQAIEEQLVFATRDRAIFDYDLLLLRA